MPSRYKGSRGEGREGRAGQRLGGNKLLAAPCQHRVAKGRMSCPCHLCKNTPISVSLWVGIFPGGGSCPQGSVPEGQLMTHL